MQHLVAISETALVAAAGSWAKISVYVNAARGLEQQLSVKAVISS